MTSFVKLKSLPLVFFLVTLAVVYGGPWTLFSWLSMGAVLYALVFLLQLWTFARLYVQSLYQPQSFVAENWKNIIGGTWLVMYVISLAMRMIGTSAESELWMYVQLISTYVTFQGLWLILPLYRGWGPQSDRECYIALGIALIAFFISDCAPYFVEEVHRGLGFIVSAAVSAVVGFVAFLVFFDVISGVTVGTRNDFPFKKDKK